MIESETRTPNETRYVGGNHGLSGIEYSNTQLSGIPISIPNLDQDHDERSKTEDILSSYSILHAVLAYAIRMQKSPLCREL